MSQHTLRYVRITNSGRLSDRYVTTQVKEASDFEKRVFGRLFLIVELASPWAPSAQVGQTIINTISREYYKSEETDLLARFEGALKKANETLDQLERTGDHNLAETLHAVVLLQADDQLHIASTGSARAWLVRDGKGSPLITPSKNGSTPTKTFSSVLSGTLQPGDRIIASSMGLLSALSDSELKTNIFGATDFVSTAIRLCNLLRSKRGQWINALVLEYQDEIHAANQPVHPLPDTLYLDAGTVGDWRLTTSQVIAKIRDTVIATGNFTHAVYRQVSDFAGQTILPKTKQLAANGRQLASKSLADLHQKALPALKSSATDLTAKLRNVAAVPNTPATPPVAPNDSLIGKTVFAIHDYQGEPEIEADELPQQNPADRVRHYSALEVQPPTQPKLEPTTTTPFLPASKFALPKVALPPINLNLRSLKMPSNLGGQSVGFVLVVVILLGLLINNLWALKAKRSEQLSRTQAAQRLTELQDKLQEAKLAKIFNQSDKALAAAQEALAGSAELQQSPLASDGAELATEAQGVLDELTATTRLNNVTELGKIDGDRLAVWQDKVTVVKNTGSLTTYPTGGGESATASVPNGETVTGLTAFDGKDGIALLSSGPTTYATTQASGPLESLSLSAGSWHNGNALTAFLGNLYALSATDNSIWKYTATDGKLAEGQSYIADGTDVSQGVDLAIDGNVYVLTKAGEIIKLNRGKRVELRVRDIPKPGDTLSDPKQIVTAGDKLYVLDKDRIIKLANDGRYEHQYALAGNEAIHAFAIKDKALFVLTNERVMKTDLE